MQDTLEPRIQSNTIKKIKKLFIFHIKLRKGCGTNGKETLRWEKNGNVKLQIFQSENTISCSRFFLAHKSFLIETFFPRKYYQI